MSVESTDEATGPDLNVNSALSICDQAFSVFSSSPQCLSLSPVLSL